MTAPEEPPLPVASARSDGPGTANQVLVVVLSACALIASLVVRYVLPDNFLRDDHGIQVAMVPRTNHLLDPSFQGVAAIYQTLGLAHAAPLAALLALSLFVACVFGAVGWERLRRARVVDLVVIGAVLMIAVVYLGQFTKEIVTLSVCTLLLLAPRSRRWDVVIVLACAVYGALLRPYWLLIAVLFLVWRVALARTRRPLLLLLVPLVAYIALQPAFGLAFGGGLQSQRDSVNSVRDDPSAVASLIVSPLPDSAGPVGVIAALLMVVLMICPVPLMAEGSLYHLASGLLIFGLWLIVLIPVGRGLLASRPGTVATRPQVVAGRAAALLFSLLLVQALFEPDYGSYLKHLTPVLPLFLALLPVALRGGSHPAPASAEPTSLTRAGSPQPAGSASIPLTPERRTRP